MSSHAEPTRTDSSGEPPGLRRLNEIPRPELESELLACLQVPRWARDVSSQRPYPAAEQLRRVADEAARRLTAAEASQAIAGHPRIGERSSGTAASWSSSEQSGVNHENERLAAELAEANRAYEKRFGQVFLICATGLDGPQILAALRERMGNDPQAEQVVVADELRKIALLRLERLIDS